MCVGKIPCFASKRRHPQERAFTGHGWDVKFFGLNWNGLVGKSFEIQGPPLEWMVKDNLS